MNHNAIDKQSHKENGRVQDYKNEFEDDGEGRASCQSVTQYTQMADMACNGNCAPLVAVKAPHGAGGRHMELESKQR